MHRIDTETAVDGRFVNKDPDHSIRATKLNAEWFNSVQEEISNLLEENGVVLDPENESQLAEMFAPFLAGEFEEITLSETSGGYSKKVKLDNESVAVQDSAPGSVKSATLNADGLVARVSSSVGGAESELKCNELVFKDVNGNVLSSLKKDDLNFGNAHLKLSSGDDSTLVISTTNAPNYTAFKNSKMTSSNQGNTAEINGSKLNLSSGTYSHASVDFDIDNNGIAHLSLYGKETSGSKYLSFNTDDGNLSLGHAYTGSSETIKLLNGLGFFVKENGFSTGALKTNVAINGDIDVDGEAIEGSSAGGAISIYYAESSDTSNETIKITISPSGIKFYSLNSAGTAWTLTNEISSNRGANPVIPRKYDAGNSTSISISLMDGETCFIHKNANSAGSLNSVTVTETISGASKTMSVSATVEAVFHVCRFGNKIFWRSLE